MPVFEKCEGVRVVIEKEIFDGMALRAVFSISWAFCENTSCGEVCGCEIPPFVFFQDDALLHFCQRVLRRENQKFIQQANFPLLTEVSRG